MEIFLNVRNDAIKILRVRKRLETLATSSGPQPENHSVVYINI